MRKLAVALLSVSLIAISCVTVAYGRVVDMSPKTGVSDSDAIFAVLGVLACGSLAVVAKKKMSE